MTLALCILSHFGHRVLGQSWASPGPTILCLGEDTSDREGSWLGEENSSHCSSAVGRRSGLS